MTKLKVCSSQYGCFFGDQLHLPCSIASVLAHAMQFVDLDPHPTFVDRRTLEQDAEQCRDADWLLCSCYCWNWRATNRLARRAKELNPKLKVVFGGPEVPDRSEGFFEQHPYVDALVHGEGERALTELLTEGIGVGEKTEATFERAKDLSVFPSPYGDFMWRLAERGRHRWVASWESNRGCPYFLSVLRLGIGHEDEGEVLLR